MTAAKPPAAPAPAPRRRRSVPRLFGWLTAATPPAGPAGRRGRSVPRWFGWLTAATPPAAPDPTPRWSKAADTRGVYAPFFAVIASVLLLLGAIAYDGPRLTAARQDALHAANEAARVAAATIASGGTTDDARSAAEERMTKSRLIYGRPIAVGEMECVGTRVQVTVVSSYIYRSALGLIRDVQPIEATGAAEAYLVLPDDTPSQLKYLGECPL